MSTSLASSPDKFRVVREDDYDVRAHKLMYACKRGEGAAVMLVIAGVTGVLVLTLLILACFRRRVVFNDAVINVNVEGAALQGSGIATQGILGRAANLVRMRRN
jgi:hypothetical protein